MSSQSGKQGLRARRTAQLAVAVLAATVAWAGTSPAAPAASPITITVAHVLSTQTLMHQELLAWASRLEQESSRQLQVKIVPNGQLGSESQLDLDVVQGVIQMEPIAISSFSVFHSPVTIFDMPFLYRDVAHQEKVMTSRWARDKINEMLRPLGVRILTYWTIGARGIISKDRPIATLGALRDLKIRVPEVPTFVETFKSLGAKPTPVSFGETYLAFKTGVVDAVECTPEQCTSIKLQEVGRYFALTNHIAPPWVMYVNERWFGSVPGPLQKLIASTLADFGKTMNARFEDTNRTNLDLMLRAGVKVVPVSPAEREKMAAAVRPFYESIYKRYGQDLRALVQQIDATR